MSDVLPFTMTRIDCCTCGVVFGVPNGFTEQRRQDKRTFWCPNGHTLSYKRNEADRLRDELAKAVRERDRQQNRAESALGDAKLAERRRRAAKGVLTKMKKRIAEGLCPRCHETFYDLKDHISAAHPDFTQECSLAGGGAR